MYYLAYAFSSEQAAKAAWEQIRDHLLQQPVINLYCARLILVGTWQMCVVIFGPTPPMPDLEQTCVQLLEAGTPVTLTAAEKAKIKERWIMLGAMHAREGKSRIIKRHPKPGKFF